ncbi:bifunctional 4-hydroxy-2-oxoglutarate aldolase/2-dehydro-3-deoxy-phosphogluconate aldolase [Phytomonospora endophytica]|uniref:2-dehydro-3-deoxy-phosphogluconate aldolase n=1 Tax=Phytomonospora endophytica TaxID=714109 RepID=A0A841FJR8_9ACTN|nr:bifunctional 4-hydroxy-2-oxoglutarate aldolase/2-dehydro-3-deoxy-phosphogluconate aldolase [Phytomonospora endophytica]MBB6036124.1 2-dehydro-3-deoxyphosphogluconate aldolase/(4S)-4-hydroxy-2-oxoglutarate aldolase [Phytomonospora endophytica]GIG67027.1 2-dehydro-3-deoxy-phosphogluconate aldolase [Phytomonospora endophytica]
MQPIQLLRLGRVLPVVVIERVDDAVPVAKALLAGGVSTLELTLRTPVALDAIERVATAVPEILVGAGTVVSPAQARDAVRAGARFLVSPGSPPALVDAMLAERVPVLPGVATVTEAMAMMARGLTELKFFPAQTSGGAAQLRAWQGPLPRLTFCPTGGITPDTAHEFLALSNVACVGGSWLTPPALIDKGDWQGIAALAAKAAEW